MNAGIVTTNITLSLEVRVLNYIFENNFPVYHRRKREGVVPLYPELLLNLVCNGFNNELDENKKKLFQIVVLLF